VFQWNTFMGSTGSDYARDLAVDGSGNVYVEGDSSTTWGSPINAFAGGGDVFVAMFAQGNNPPNTPIADNPPDETVIPEGSTVTLDTSDYIDPDGDGHDETRWEVWRADNGMFLTGYPLTITQDPGLTIHDITATLDAGLKYIWQVGYIDIDGNPSWSKEYSFKVGDSVPDSLPEVPAGKDVGDFGMISIVHWPDDPSPTAVFNIDYDPSNYRIGTYDAVKNRYIEFGDGLKMEPGRSYWILAREGLVINLNGIPVSSDTEVYVALDYNDYSDSNPDTGNGWNMVAPPNNFDYYWSNVRVVEDVAGTLTDRGLLQGLADNNPYIDRKLWRWENGAYVSDTPESDLSQEMAAYQGYWVQARQANVFLRFDPAARVASLSMSETLIARAWHKTRIWLSNLDIFSQEAVADNDTPPMPMGGLDDNTVDPVFQGCFIETILITHID
jgi:hypothetical protein